MPLRRRTQKGQKKAIGKKKPKASALQMLALGSDTSSFLVHPRLSGSNSLRQDQFDELPSNRRTSGYGHHSGSGYGKHNSGYGKHHSGSGYGHGHKKHGYGHGHHSGYGGDYHDDTGYGGYGGHGYGHKKKDDCCPLVVDNGES